MAFRFNLITGNDMTMEPPTVTLKYRSEGAPEPLPGLDMFDYVASFALAVVPATYTHPLGILHLQDIQIHENWYAKEYMITAPYTRKKGKQAGAFQITVDQIGGTVHVIAGRRIAGFGPDADKVDNGGLIGVDGDEVHGVDIPIEETRINIRFRHPQGTLNAAYIKATGRLVGFPNDDGFLTYAPGEVLYLGGNFDESETEASAQYSFVISYNRSNFPVGPIIVSEKSGWDVISVIFKDDVDDGAAVKKIRYVEIVRPAGREWKNYATVFGWGGT